MFKGRGGGVGHLPRCHTIGIGSSQALRGHRVASFGDVGGV